MAQTEIIAEPGRQEVVVTRILNASREVIFKTVTDPLLVPRWWGLRRLTTQVIK